MRTELILAIDPGLEGAFALLAPTGDVIAVEDLPVIEDASLSWIDGSVLTSRLFALRNGVATRAIVERVSAMPKQGVSSTFKFGVTFGSILGALRVLQIPIEFVTPVSWKRAIGLPPAAGRKDSAVKGEALDKARLLYPEAPLHLQKHHGRAEALLIAHWFINRHELKAAA